MHIVVLGGTGAMGRVTVRTLTEYEDVGQITIADYDEERAHDVAATLNSSKILVRQIDVCDSERLSTLVRGATFLANAICTFLLLPCSGEQLFVRSHINIFARGAARRNQ